MRRYFSIATMCLCLFGGVLPAHADRDAPNVTIAEMTMGTTTGNVLFIRVNPAPPSNTTPCHQNTYWHYTLPLNTELGKNLYALLLSLIAMDKPFGIAGSGLCNEYTPPGNAVESLRGIGATF
ncbi:hypothetical protein [Peristeroidobacter soli]|uniref:hypothetical protein n=1 Tax=Peristeroidobacter soli TaxID=2497877 RepID=UPI00101B76A1|nr:hypothetical protein [Peristeroidobacter soli]